MLKAKYFILLICFSFLLKTEAKVTLTSIWGDNMVLQQQSEVTFSGTATSGKRVQATASWNNKKIQTNVDAKGEWKLSLQTPVAGGPYSITFSDGEDLTLQNILIGEVWFCSGQSNMEMPVKGFRGQPVFGSQPYIVSANPKRPLRLYTVKNAWSTIPQEAGVDGEWKEASPEDVADFSATAYFFGNQLQQSLDVPVGLIHCSWSMSKIEAWMNKETLSGFPEIALPDVIQREFGWTAGTPTLLWNAMVNPWKGFPVKGVIWYQGEANTPDPGLYKRLFPAMVSQWRTFFNNPQMPFYYVQIAPWKSEGNDKLDWAWFRQCQLELMSAVPNVGMVTTGDAGSENFIHSPYKIKVGERLAYWALAKEYGVDNLGYKTPVYKSMEVKEGKVYIAFDNAQGKVHPINRPLSSFEIAGKDRKFYPAEAIVDLATKQLQVWNKEVSEPVAVRYAFHNYAEASLFDYYGLPVAPFRTDKW